MQAYYNNNYQSAYDGYAPQNYGYKPWASQPYGRNQGSTNHNNYDYYHEWPREGTFLYNNHGHQQGHQNYGENQEGDIKLDSGPVHTMVRDPVSGQNHCVHR